MNVNGEGKKKIKIKKDDFAKNPLISLSTFLGKKSFV